MPGIGHSGDTGCGAARETWARATTFESGLF